MNSINYKLREAANSLLTPNLQYQGQAVPVFNAGVKTGMLPDLYVYIGAIRSQENTSPKEMHRLQASITIYIVSKTLHNSNQEALDTLADQIYSTLYPERRSTLTIDGMAIVDNTVGNDIVSDLATDGQKMYLTRTITFDYIIFLS